MALETKDIEEIVGKGLKGLETQIDEKNKTQFEDGKKTNLTFI